MDTAGSPAEAVTPTVIERSSEPADPAPTARPPRFYRSLAAKAAVLAVIFLVVPLIVYDQFRRADEAGRAMLLKSVGEQGRVMSQALMPLLSTSERPSLPQLGRELARFAGDVTNVKLLYAPVGENAFFYVASWPTVPAAQLDMERERLSQQGVLERLSSSCQGDLPFAVRYRTPTGDDEIVTSTTPIKATNGCWALVTSFSAGAYPGSNLGRPYWATPEVRIAAAAYLAMAFLTFTAFWGIRRGLYRFTERARAIRDRQAGKGSFSATNEVPELTVVAYEFDRMVEVLGHSAQSIRRAAEDNAHAFKTPIAVIRQSLEPLKRAVGDQNLRGSRALGLIESSLDKLDGLVASARRLDETTADLIDTARAPVNLSRLLKHLLQTHTETAASQQIAFRGHIDSDVTVFADEGMLETVIENLLENAISFSPKGSGIGVTLEARGRMAELVIADSGPGVEPDNLQRIFERYFSQRPHRNEDGDSEATHFGIGLWIARRNIEALGGKLRAENRTPHGLVMRITLPLHTPGRAPS